MNTQIQDDNFKLLEESDYDRIDNTFKLYKGDVLINHRRDKLTQLLKDDENKQSAQDKTKKKTKTKQSAQDETKKTPENKTEKKTKTKQSVQDETKKTPENKTEDKTKTKQSAQDETKKTPENKIQKNKQKKSSKSRKKHEQKLQKKENILVKNFETNFENNFVVKRIKTVYTHIDSALSEINYKNSFVQIALILSFVYILTALIQTIHININY